jgi:1,2-diacylglycerol 3-alpha-glucosyltransferase
MLPDTPSVIIPNAIDRSQFQKTHVSEEQKHKLRESYGIKDNEVLALFVGRIAEEKRVFELLEICKNVLLKDSTCKFMFVGSGPACEEMKERAKSEIESGKIIFTGFVEWAKVHEFYESGDLFITSSLSEMHSMTILEAQLSALPIVVRRDESYLDCIFDGENGYLTDNDEELEEKILDLVKDSKKRKQFGIRSLEIAGKFTIETHVARTLLVYNEVIKAYPGKIDDVIVNKQVAEL